MSVLNSRLGRLLPGLTARQRVKLLVDQVNAGARPDRKLLDVPESQRYEVQRLLDLARGANTSLATVINGLGQEMRVLQMQLGWIASMQLWAMNAWAALAELMLVPELVTESEHARRVEAAREEWWELDDAVEFLLLCDEATANLDGEDWDAAWEAREKELRQRVRAKTLKARGKGGDLRLQAGGVYDLAETVPEVAEVGTWALVVPDSRAKDAERANGARQRLHAELGQAPLAIRIEGGRVRIQRDPAARSPADELVRMVLDALLGDFFRIWGELLALEQILRELDEEVGTEVLNQYSTEYLAGIRAELVGVHARVEALLGETPLPGPSEEALETFWGLLRKDSFHR